MYVFLSVILYLAVGIILGFMMCMESKDSLYNDFKKEIIPMALFWFPKLVWYAFLGLAITIMYVTTYVINACFEVVHNGAKEQ